MYRQSRLFTISVSSDRILFFLPVLTLAKIEHHCKLSLSFFNLTCKLAKYAARYVYINWCNMLLSALVIWLYWHTESLPWMPHMFWWGVPQGGVAAGPLLSTAAWKPTVVQVVSLVSALTEELGWAQDVMTWWWHHIEDEPAILYHLGRL